MTNLGWECPKCGGVYGPHVDGCPYCVPVLKYEKPAESNLHGPVPNCKSIGEHHQYINARCRICGDVL